MNILDFQNKKNAKEKITMITCYDYSSARLLAETNIDCLLVGDSVAMTMHGYANSLAATVDMMLSHTAAVSRGAGKKCIVTDLPFLSYRGSIDQTIQAVQAIMQAGAHAVKLEGAAGNLELIQCLVESGVPVMGHLGLTPQFIHQLGGYKVQGTNSESAEKMKQDALALEKAGCFALVLECVPAKLANEMTAMLTIPSIGIGAGAGTDGQVLVYQDLLGLNADFLPKFVKIYLQGSKQVKEGIENYIQEVKAGEFPKDEHCYYA